MVAQIDKLYIETSYRKVITRLLSYIFFEGRPITTKGQWLNPLILQFFKLQKKLPQLKAVNKPVFIIGVGRSGTTILGNLLSMHHDVGFLNEPKALWHAIYPEEDLVGTYARGPAKYRLTSKDVSEKNIDDAHKLFGAYLAITGTHRVVDKYPELIFRVPFVKSLFPDAKFIFLVRNGWDTCQSIEGWWSKKERVSKKTERHDWWGVDNRKWNLLLEQIISTDQSLMHLITKRQELENPLDMAILEWILAMKEGINLMNTFPHSVYKLHYEDLITSPNTSLQSLLDFCELPPSTRLLNYASQKLCSSPPRNKINISPSIASHFQETMQALGYLP
ncbi:MAG: sulfotransferase [Cyanobacteria bacterium P01_D01_bin.156]